MCEGKNIACMKERRLSLNLSMSDRRSCADAERIRTRCETRKREKRMHIAEEADRDIFKNITI